MRECRAVKVEAERIVGAFAWRREPDETRLRVDEAANQPSAGNAIDPHALSRRPRASLIVVDRERLDDTRRGMGLTRRQHRVDERNEVLPRDLGAGCRVVGEIIDRADGVEILAQAAQQAGQFGGGLAGERFAGFGETVNERCIIVAAIEQRAKFRFLRRVEAWCAQQVRGAAAVGDRDGEFAQHCLMLVRKGEQVDAVA